jgi:DNA-binding NtrC family response regulator
MSNRAVNPKVLVVEDEPRMRELLARAIGSWGFATSTAHSGEEALRAMEQEAHQVILLDLNLPAMSGMECFERIHQRWPDAEVIILTGFGDLEAAKQAIRMNVVEFLTKPTHLGELEKALGRAKLRLLESAPLPVSLDTAPASPRPPSADAPGGATLEEVERQHILASLARHGGNRAATAAELGISLRTLYYRLSEYQKQGFRVD